MASFINNNRRNVITGTPGDDFFQIADGTTGAGNDVFDGLGGNDFAEGGTGNDRLFGGDGNDLLEGGEGDDLVRGGNGNDTIRDAAGANGDRLYGEAGDDSIYCGTLGSGSLLDGGDGNDWLYAGKGGDTLIGGDGNDMLHTGGLGDQRLVGGAGDDVIDARFTGNHTLIGGAGADRLNVFALGNLVLDLSLPSQTITGNAGTGLGDRTLTISGFESFWSGSGNDTIRGSAAANGISGREGNDRIWGLGGDDFLDGGSGRDILRGGGGNDIFTEGWSSIPDGGDRYYGGAGQDRFRFSHVANSPASNPDTIHDFEALVDTIEIRNFVGPTGGTVQWQAYRGADPFTGTGPEVRLAGGRLEADANGDGIADFALLLPGVTSLTPGRFFGELLMF